VALERGELLWRYGLPAAALRALRAGVPAAYRPALPKGVNPQRAGPLRAPPLRWHDDQLIGHYRQNLYLAARLLWAAGAPEAARAHLRAAATAGLWEATRKDALSAKD
jgi:hypothetical protein